MKTKFILLGVATILSLSTPAFAGGRDHHDNGWRGHGYGHGHHHRAHRDKHDRSRVSLSLNFGAPAYYRYRPYPPAPYYASTQYIYTQPIAVTQPLGQGAFEDRYCREYQTTSRVGGRLQPSYGTACYQPDGSWQIVAD